jgi:SNF2 family DNA or RNA helicase
VNLYADAPRLDGNLVIPHGLREYMLLKHLGYVVPHPMLSYYNWGSKQPFKVQLHTCTMLTSHPRAYVLNDMGTGKTKTALWSWDFLRTHGYAGKLLIVAPLSTLNFVWGRECFATLPGRKVAVLHGSKAQRLAKLADPTIEIFIINHHGVQVIADALLARTDIDTLVLDELAVYRNNSDRSKLMRKFAERFQWVWGMTGAPMPNQPTDVWSQAKIITPNTVPKFFKQAREMLMIKVDMYTYRPKPDAVEQAFRMMQPSVRYALDDVVELPEFVSRVIDVDLSDEQKKVYERMSNMFQVMIQEKQITAVNAAAAMNKLLQVALGWVYTKSPDFVALDSTPRIAALMDIINSAARKVIVFVPYRHALAGLAQVMEKEDIEHAVVHGDVGDRDTIFNLFQNTAKYKVLLAHPECVAHGLTLTAADTTVWACPTASLDIYDQANARIRRVGQKHKQQFLHLQATPVEKRIYSLLRSKQRVQDKLLELFEEDTERRLS